jgi:hypothetical protein
MWSSSGRTGEASSEGATVIAVHWRGEIDDWPLTVEEAHSLIAEAGQLTRVARLQDPDFLLEVLERWSRRSRWSCPRTTRSCCCPPA